MSGVITAFCETDFSTKYYRAMGKFFFQSRARRGEEIHDWQIFLKEMMPGEPYRRCRRRGISSRENPLNKHLMLLVTKVFSRFSKASQLSETEGRF